MQYDNTTAEGIADIYKNYLKSVHPDTYKYLKANNKLNPIAKERAESSLKVISAYAEQLMKEGLNGDGKILDEKTAYIFAWEILHKDYVYSL